MSTMAMNTVFISATNWVSCHLNFSDIAISLLTLFIFSSVLQKLTNNRGAPMLWPVLGVIPSSLLHLHDMYDWITKIFTKSAGKSFHYHGMWMAGSHGIVTVDPSNIEYILQTNFHNFPKGKYYRERFSDLLGDGIFNSDGDLWKRQRRLAVSEMHSGRFSDHSIKTMQELVHRKLLKLTAKMADSGERVDFQEILLRFTFDNICMAALGVDPGCLELNLPQIPFAKAFEEATEFTLFRFLVPSIFWKPLKVLRLGFEKRLEEAIRIVHGFADKTVADRRSEMSTNGGLNYRSDLLSRLMDYENCEKNEGFSDKYLRDFCISFILAGRDTTSVALAWFFWLVDQNLEVETKIVAEIDEILSGRRWENEDPDEVVFTVAELKKMVYLQAALSESLRLYPSVPIDVKEVLEDDVLPDGSVVKKGARVLYCVFAMARMESIWGKDCTEFRPERWLSRVDGEFVSENQFKYAVFNGGQRLCVGKKFAYMQMKMVAASILWRYRVEVVGGHEVVPKVTTTLYMKNGLLVTLKPRF